MRGGGSSHGVALVKHGSDDWLRNALLFQINNLRGIEGINRPGILDVSDNRIVANFGLGKLQHGRNTVRKVRSRRSCV